MPPRKPHRATSVGDSIIEGLTEFRNTLREGVTVERRFTVRKVRRDLGPPALSSAEVRAIRLGFQASQGIFAALIGVSAKTLQSWEQGAVCPPIACRLLSAMAADPEPWLKLLLRAAAPEPAKRVRRAG